MYIPEKEMLFRNFITVLELAREQRLLLSGITAMMSACCWKLDRAMQLLLPARKPSRPPDTYWRNQVRTVY